MNIEIDKRSLDSNQLQSSKDTDMMHEYVESNFLKYRQYFSGLQKAIDCINNHDITKQQLIRHRIKILDQKQLRQRSLIYHGNTFVEYAGDQQNGLVCIFQILVGRFLFVIKLLNLHRNSEDDSQCIGKGSYGIVKKIDLGNHKFAIKKIKFQKKQNTSLFIPHLMDPDDKSDKTEIRHAIKQYCIYKICSMLKIGPQIIFQNNYDIVCYNDCIQFYMQLCDHIQKISNNQYKQDLKICVAVLHSLNFVHKDIKPANVLYCPSTQKYVLCDFGITHSIKQKIGQKTLTYPEGTYEYASQQMKKLFHNKNKGYIDLYLNDIHSLQLTFEEFERLQQQFSGSYQQNSLSMMGSESEQQISQSINQLSFKQNKEEELNRQINQQQGSYRSQIILVQNSTSVSTNMSFIKFSSEINFCQMKVIFQILKIKHKQQKHIINLVKQITQSSSNDNLYNTVLKLVQQIFFPAKQYQKNIFKFRNCVRVFGISSNQAIVLLQQFIFAKPIPTIGYKQIQNKVTLLKKYENYRYNIKDIEILQIERRKSMALKNHRSRFSVIKSIIKQYHRKDKLSLVQQKQLVLRGIQLLIIQDLTDKETNQIYFLLNNVCQQTRMLTNIASMNRKQKIQVIKQVQHKYLSDCNNECLILLKLSQIYTLLDYKQGSSRMIDQIKQIRKQHQSNITVLKQPNSGIAHKHIQQLYLMMIWQVQYHFNNQDQRARQIMEQLLQFSKTYKPDTQLHIRVIDAKVKLSIRQRQLETAQLYNQLSYKFKQQLLFPKDYGIEFAYYYFYAGLISLGYKCYQQAIDCWEHSLKNIMSSIRTSANTQMMHSCFTNIAYCYQKLDEPAKVCECLQTAFYCSLKYNFFNPQETVQNLQNLVFILLKMNRLDDNLKAYFDQLAQLKASIFDREIVQYSKNDEIMVEFINYSRLKKQILNVQAFIFALKSITFSLEPRLPKFLYTYLNACDQIASHYFQTKRINFGLQYLWRYFKYHWKSKNSKQYYDKMNFYVTNLMKNQSNRRALLFLKRHIKNIPEQYRDYRCQCYRKLTLLTRQLNTKDKKYYGYIWRNKSFVSQQNWQISSLGLRQYCNGNYIQQIIWHKKLKHLRTQPNTEDQSS